jgi:hypothetical protein
MKIKCLILSAALLTSVIAPPHSDTSSPTLTLRPGKARVNFNVLALVTASTALVVALLGTYCYYSVKTLKFLWEERTTCQRRHLSQKQCTPEGVKTKADKRQSAVRTLNITAMIQMAAVASAIYAFVAYPCLPITHSIYSLLSVGILSAVYSAAKRSAKGRAVTGVQYAVFSTLTLENLLALIVIPGVLLMTIPPIFGSMPIYS